MIVSMLSCLTGLSATGSRTSAFTLATVTCSAPSGGATAASSSSGWNTGLPLALRTMMRLELGGCRVRSLVARSGSSSSLPLLVRFPSAMPADVGA